MKLLIAIPAYESMRVEFVRSLMDLSGWLNENKVPYEVMITEGTLVHVARDKLARYAVNNHFDEVLWIDSDMVFDRHVYEDLRDAGKDMVCGWFISRHYPYISCLFRSFEPVERIDTPPEDLFRVAGCGFGCVLMKTEVLKRVMTGNGGRCFVPDQKYGEDCAFCRRAEGCGFEIWCNPSVRVGHVGNVTIWPDEADRMRGDIQGIEGLELN